METGWFFQQLERENISHIPTDKGNIRTKVKGVVDDVSTQTPSDRNSKEISFQSHTIKKGSHFIWIVCLEYKKLWLWLTN